MEVIIVAVLVSIISPILLAQLTGRQRLNEKREDWKRQDEVANKAAEAAKLLLIANERVAETTAVTNEKLDVIHTLVNSNMTAAMQAELDATNRELAMMREVIDLKLAAGHEPTIFALAAIKTTEDKIHELEAKISDRLETST